MTDPRLARGYRRAAAAFAVGCALAAAAVRLPQLDVFLTPDETRWACRSTNFFHALAAGNLAATYQKEHPGVVTMWLGGLGQPIDDTADWRVACRDIDPSDLVAEAPRPALDEITARLFRGRQRVALFVSLCVGLMTWLVGRLLGHRVALFAGLIIALEPFFVAHGRVLHLDGVTTSLMTLSLLWLLLWQHRGRRRRDLLLSGAMAGLAAVNKSPALIMAPIAGLLIAADAVAARRPRTAREAKALLGPLARDVIVAVAAWGAAATAAYVVVWPAMWLAPIDVLRRVLGGAESYAEQGHEGGNYFWGRPVFDPGPAFYPVAWALRTSPVAMVGLALAGWCGWRWRREGGGDGGVAGDGARHAVPLHHVNRDVGRTLADGDDGDDRDDGRARADGGDRGGEPGRHAIGSHARVGARHAVPPAAERPSWAGTARHRPILLALVAYAVLFALVMTGGAKKFDRYLLPVFPALDIVAAWGIAMALGGWGGRGRRAGRAGDGDDARAPAVAALAAVRAEAAVAFGALGVAWALALMLRAHRPYYLDAYNPLAGGARAAEFALLLGWGEGLDQAAAWLNAQPDAADGEVAMRYRSAVGPLIAGHALEMNKIDVATVDHYLFYRNQLQRRLDPALIERYFGPEAPTDRAPTPVVAPDATITLGGLAYGWLFANRNWEPAAHFIDDRADPQSDAVLVRAASGFARGFTGPLDVIEVDPDAADAAVDALLDDAFAAHARLWWVRYDDLVPYPGLQRVDDALATRAVRTAEAAFDEVRVARFDRPADGAIVGGANGDGGATAAVTATAGLSATAVLTAPIAFFDRDAPDPAVAVALVGVELPAGPAEPGRGLPVTLRWARPTAGDADLVGFVHVVAAADVGAPDARRIAQDDRPLRDGAGQPTSQWAAGAVEAERRVVAFPAGTVPGRYRLLVGVYDGATGRRLDAAPRAAGDPTSLKDVRRLADGVFAVPIEVGRSPAAFDDSALGLSHGHLDAALTDGVALWGFDVARPVEAGGAAAVAAVWSVPGGAGAATAAMSATVGTASDGDAAPATASAASSTGASTDVPAFVHIRITDTLGANVGDVTAPIVALPVDAWRAGDRLRADYLVPLYGRALAGEGFIRFSLLDADGRPLPGRGPDGRAAIVAPFTIDGPLRSDALPPDVPARARRDVVFGELARLRAAEVAVDRVDVGAPVTVTLWWEALAQTDAPHLVDLGLRDAAGDVVAADAFAPADGRRPTTSWLSGEVVRDRRIVVADVDPGRYDVVVRLTAADGGDPPVAASGAGAGGGDGWVAVGRVTVR